MTALTAERFLEATTQLQMGGKFMGSRQTRISDSFDALSKFGHSEMMQPGLRLSFKLSALCLFDLAKCRIGAVR